MHAKIFEPEYNDFEWNDINERVEEAIMYEHEHAVSSPGYLYPSIEEALQDERGRERLTMARRDNE